jgi:serine/threonine protein kinase
MGTIGVMKNIDGICQELQGLDGVLGAFVMQQAHCLGKSMPPDMGEDQLGQVMTTLERIGQISKKAGFDRSIAGYHWQKASLFTWPFCDDLLLGILSSPNALQEAIELSVSIAIEDLTCAITKKTSLKPPPSSSSPPKSVSSNLTFDAALVDRLEAIERLLVEEMGPSGKALLERCRNRNPRGQISSYEWLLRLRNTVLSEITDPGARVTIGTSLHWTELH